MPDFYLVAVVLLFLLALVDLSVGVSNDAVNFLNSAIGSQVATRRTIMIVASIGILCGALFSSGMMEVARKGIFNPELFTFADVMVIFLAVMLADVILLDLFNTFGLPTSTTVSIVFELLGAAVMVALLTVIADPAHASIVPFINTASALAIVSGIVLSVGVAFTVGTIVMFVSRLFFSFDRAAQGPLLIAGWSAIALAAITDFLFIKGLKGAAFVPPEAVLMVNAHPLLTGLGLFVFWLIVAIGLQRLGVQPLRVVVLAGTFALAMAFASNDLVNFIGVPLAGLASWRSWSESGVAPDALSMVQLGEPVRGDTVYLVGAGVIMIITLWVSTKARSVTETEVNLGRQDEGSERFSPGPVSRAIVGASLAAAQTVPRWVPPSTLERIAARFDRPPEPVRPDAPAFDLIRASVNLTVAAILIAIATSLKLPLSTTYVSFMVAMGASLADRAWGRDSAVYRVSGVLNVIAGWFATAFIAFTAAACFAFVIHRFETAGALVLVLVAAFALVRSHFFHARRSAAVAEEGTLSLAGLSSEEAVDRMRERIANQVDRLAATTEAALGALEAGDKARLEPAARHLGALSRATEIAERRLVGEMKRAGVVRPEEGPWLLVLFDAEQRLLDGARTIVETIDDFIRNGLRPPAPTIIQALAELRETLAEAIAELARQARGQGGDARATIATARAHAMQLLEAQLADLEEPERTARNAAMQLKITIECLDLVDAMDALAARLGG